MTATSFRLDRRRAEGIAQLARSTERSVDDLLGEAVDDFLARHALSDEAWRARLERVVAKMRAGVPTDASPEEIEADIGIARAEVREQGRAAGGR